MTTLERAFQTKEKILSIYTTAGFPHFDSLYRILPELSGKADVIEIGIPFSDPIADGPIIQNSNKIALLEGMTLRRLLEQIKTLRTKIETPILLMGYLNSILKWGLIDFASECRKSGVQGVILPDLPLSYFRKHVEPVFKAYDLVSPFLISPQTAEDRILEIDQASTGFLYVVSSFGITGKNSPADVTFLKKISRTPLKNRLLVGFGIRDKQTFDQACQFASGAIIGSAFIKTIENSNDLKKDISRFINTIRGSR